MQPANNHAASTSGTSGSTSPKNKKKGMSVPMIILLVVAIVVVVGILVLVILVGVFDMWVITLADTEEGVSPPWFTIEDGHNTNDSRGCFFIIMVMSRGEDIDSFEHSFFVSEKGYAPKELDFSERQYIEGQPVGGDRNATFEWTQTDDIQSYQEYVGFDMPMEDMGINITDGNVYEVLIINPESVVIFKDTFVYSKQG